MYARISTFQVKPDQIAAMLAVMPETGAKLKQVPGILECKSAIDSSGKGVVFALYPSPEAAALAADAIRGVWGGLMGFLAGPPSAGGYEHVNDLLG